MKKTFSFWFWPLALMGIIMMLAISCGKDDNNNEPDKTAKDIDGNVYHTITIGTQVWMVENLRTTKYRNGDPIPNVTNDTEWSNLTTGAQCNYNNDSAIGNKHGKLYNWYAVSDSRNIAPTGWHVPTDAEWTTLEEYVASNLGTSGSVAKALASKADWTTSNNTGAVGNDLTINNSSGFSGMPAGRRIGPAGSFVGVGDRGNWWTSTESSGGCAWYRKLNYDDPELIRDESSSDFCEDYGFSVRCLRD